MKLFDEVNLLKSKCAVGWGWGWERCFILVFGFFVDEVFELLFILSLWISVIYYVYLDNWNNKDEMDIKDLLFYE